MTDTFDLKDFHAINGMAAPGLHPTLDHVMAFIAQYALEMYAVTNFANGCLEVRS